MKVPYKLALGTVEAFDTLIAEVSTGEEQAGLGGATVLTGYTTETIATGVSKNNVAEIHNQITMMLGHEIFDPETGRRVLVDLGKHYRLKLIDVELDGPPTPTVRFEGDRLLFRRE